MMASSQKQTLFVPPLKEKSTTGLSLSAMDNLKADCKKAAVNIGSLGIHGDHAGDRKVSSNFVPMASEKISHHWALAK